MSVKKYAPYRQDKGDRYRWNKKDQEKLHELKSRIKDRSGNAFGMRSTVPSGEKAKKRKGKKERMKAKVAFGQPEEVVPPTDDRTSSSGDGLDTTSFKKRKHDEGNGQTGTTGEVEPQKKKKRKHQTV